MTKNNNFNRNEKVILDGQLKNTVFGMEKDKPISERPERPKPQAKPKDEK